MKRENQIIFDGYRLDLANECLWRGSQAIKLRPKAFALLHYLIGQPGQLVTKEQLLNAIWPETFVGEAVLKVTVRQLREALDDDPKSPRFIETVHRRGYRFIGQVAAGEPPPVRNREAGGHKATSTSPLRAAGALLGIVGRDKALSRMRGWLEKMLRGQRQIAFVTGEAGIGKTALVDTFAREVASDPRLRISRGQCLQHYGTSEAFLPVLEAIGRLCRQERQVVDVLRAHAPMWLLQMPALLSPADRESLSREVHGATRERMLREMGEALGVLTADQPLVLILEDLHWSDYSTLDLISYLARQPQAARLMLIGTYRTTELIASGHPLKAVKQELLAKRQCKELPVEYLSEDAIAEYLSLLFPANRFPAELARLIHQRTEGNPLFMVNVIDYFVAEGLIAEDGRVWQLSRQLDNVEMGVPDSIKQMIEKQIEHLDLDVQRTLEVASVAGAEFSLLAVAAGLDEDSAPVEARCEELARQGQFIQSGGVHVLPNGEAVSRYGFIHALYQNVLYERLSEARRVQLHRRIGERGEAVYGERAREIAAELAMHFERAADPGQAARHLQRAADNDIRRFAYRDAVGLARRGLELLLTLPDTPERADQELCLQLTLGVPLIALEGYAAPEVGRVYQRARQLSQQLGETPDVSEALWGLWTFHTVRAEFATAREIAEEFLRLAKRLPYPGLAMRGHWTLEITSAHLGEFAQALEHFEKALSLYDPERHRDDKFLYALDPGVAMPCFAAWALWFIGQPDQALVRIRQALTHARRLAEPLNLAHAHLFAAFLHQFRREEPMAEQSAEVALSVSSEHGLALYQAMAKIMHGWTRRKRERHAEVIEQMRQGLAELQATDTELVRPHFLGLLAETLTEAGRTEEGLGALEEALTVAQRNGERYYEAELYRLKGELLRSQLVRRDRLRAAAGGSVSVEAEPLLVARAASCFNQAIKIAQRQRANSLELRAATSLARLYQNQARQEEARTLLTQAHDRFTEGFNTLDLCEAKALLAELI